MNPLRALLDVRSVVVMRASGEDTIADGVSANLISGQSGRQVAVVCLDRSTSVPDGSYDTLLDLPFVPDLAVICAQPPAAAEALDQVGRKGVRVAVVIATDPDGHHQVTPFKAALRDAARRSGCRFLGPGSVGINMPITGLNASWVATCPAAGRIALVSQSGAITAGVVNWAAARGIGLSRIISTGDEGDIGIDEVLDFLAADNQSTGILVYLRTLSTGRAFVSSARATSRIKPVLVLKPQQEDALRRSSDAIVERDEVYDAVFQRTGLLRVSDTAEWFDAAESLSSFRRRRTGKLVVLANGQGPAELTGSIIGGRLAKLQDKTIAALSNRLPARISLTNPLLLGPDATPEHYASALTALQDDADVAAVLVICTPSPSGSTVAIAKIVADSARRSKLAFLACWFGVALNDEIRAVLAESNVALHDTPEEAARAFIHLDQHSRNQEALRQIPVSRRHELVSAGAEWVTSGIPAAPALLPADDLETTAFLAIYATIWRAIKGGRAQLDDVESTEVLRSFGLPVSPRPATDFQVLPLSLALVNDPVFGRIIVLTAVGERAVVLPPLNRELTREPAANAEAAIRQATGVGLDIEILQDIAIHLADLAVQLPEIVRLETTSVGISDGDLVIAGARIQVAVPESAGNHLSIHPYPRELEERVKLSGGKDALIRPIRLEDIGLYHKMLNSIPASDLNLRFCSVFGDLTQAIPTELLANLIHFDYSRDMTFIAVVAGDSSEPVACGVVDAFILPGREEAEYSILVRSDLAGTGLGKALMTKIINYCRAQGVGSLFGLVLRNNARMLGLCARLGFVRAGDANDDDMVKVVLAL